MKVSERIILYNNSINEEYNIMGFNSENLEHARPGQFISISVPGIEDNMPLRRPFTIYRIKDNSIEILYKIAGRGTKFYSTLKKGDKINILGPLGNGFQLVKESKVLIIGRGCGLATLAELGHQLKELGCNITTIGSFRNKELNIMDRYIRAFSKEIIELYDEDKTSNVDSLKKIVLEVNPDIIYCSGSKRILKMLQQLKYQGQVSLEERMGCGLGACMACSVDTIDGYKRVCKDGPCFSIDEVII